MAQRRINAPPNQRRAAENGVGIEYIHKIKYAYIMHGTCLIYRANGQGTMHIRSVSVRVVGAYITAMV